MGAGAGALSPRSPKDARHLRHPNSTTPHAGQPGGSAFPTIRTGFAWCYPRATRRGFIRTGFAWCYLRATRRGLKYNYNNPMRNSSASSRVDIAPGRIPPAKHKWQTKTK